MGIDIGQAISALLADTDSVNAIAFEGRWLSRRWLADQAAAIDALLAEAGVGPGDPVALVARNRPAHIAAIAAQMAGARTTIMVHAAQSAAALARQIAALDARAVLADTQDWAAEPIAAVESRGMLGIALGEIAHAVNRLPGEARGAARRPDTAFDLLSSGTTGPPKRLPLSWHAIAEAVSDAAQVYAAGQDGPSPAIVVHPIANVAGVTFALPALVNGQPIVLLEKFRLDAWVEAVRVYRPLRVSIPPAGIAMLLDTHVPPADLASLTAIGVGGGRLEPAIHELFEARYGVPVLPGYGATEFGGVIANWSLELHRAFAASKRGSVGRARPGVTLRVVDPHSGEPLPEDTVGLLEARVPRVGPDFIRTTDLARIDADGFLHLHGRADQAINRGGFTIMPDHVASVLREHPAVGDAVVFGMADPRLGEVPVAAVEGRPGHDGPDSAALMAFARERLAAYEVPTRILVLDALPRTDSMKPSIPATRCLFESELSA